MGGIVHSCFCSEVLLEKRLTIPAVTHVDVLGCRQFQSLTILNFELILNTTSGVPVLLNTSFNVAENYLEIQKTHLDVFQPQKLVIVI